MALTVYSEGLGLFHQGSSGKGIAQADVCLSPPPPPAGPVPVPYVNTLSASDLADGSKTVKIDGNPTALEDHSYVSTSTGDEGGTQGGNVVTHKTKGKGYFKLWSFTVQIEGKGIARHGDPMGQNCASDPPGCIDMDAVVAFQELDWVIDAPCEEEYVREDIQEYPNDEQYEAVRGQPCWQCGADDSYKRDPEAMVPDHQPPMAIAWYMGGCQDPEAFEEWANDTETVKPHCLRCSDNQKNVVSNIVRGKPNYAAVLLRIKGFLGL
jgi:uncharacterized Zn-binding protein involved in type VI secretion